VIAQAPRWFLWASAAVLAGGAALTSSVLEQGTLTLRRPLADAVPAEMVRFVGEDTPISEEELAVVGVTDYLMRVYEAPEPQAAAAPWMSVYVGFYESQTRGKTIHSPKNCMPGSGWEALAARTVDVPVGSGSVQVNRYLLVNGTQQVLVLYWYQGRGRVVASEYQAKWELLRDAALKRRSDEALVRVVVPIVNGEEERAFGLALSAAQSLVPAIGEALPAA
jgi:EpsI family protein